MLVSSNQKEFEKPKSGLYRGVLADIVDLGPVAKVFKGVQKVVPMVRLVWLLNSKDKEGNFFRVMREVTATMSEKSNLFGLVREITGAVPKVPYELENIIGRNNELVISLDTAANGKQYANVKAILAPQTTEVFTIPANFTRSKDRKNQQATQQGTTVQQAQQAAPAVAAPAIEVGEEDIPF